MTAATIRAHLDYMAERDPAYAAYARGWYLETVGQYLRGAR